MQTRMRSALAVAMLAALALPSTGAAACFPLYRDCAPGEERSAVLTTLAWVAAPFAFVACVGTLGIACPRDQRAPTAQAVGTGLGVLVAAGIAARAAQPPVVAPAPAFRPLPPLIMPVVVGNPYPPRLVIRPKYPTIGPNDGFMEPGSRSNPFVIEPE